MYSSILKSTIGLIFGGVILLISPYALKFIAYEDGFSPQFANIVDILSTVSSNLGKGVILFGLAIIGGIVFFKKRESKTERRQMQETKKLREEYNNSLFNILKQFTSIEKSNEDSEILKKFWNIANMILATEEGNFAKENMRFFDEHTYHEILALKEILKAFNKNIPITDETILNSLQQVTKGLQKHYDVYYQRNLEGVKEELYILTKLEKQ